jgi:hypothetical protein
MPHAGEFGGLLPDSVFRRAWRTARQEVLPPEDVASPLGGHPAGAAAERAGNSVPVLLATYARCISGQLKDHQRRIEAGGDLADLSRDR